MQQARGNHKLSRSLQWNLALETWHVTQLEEMDLMSEMEKFELDIVFSMTKLLYPRLLLLLAHLSSPPST